MLDQNLVSGRFSDSNSHWIRSFSLESLKCLIVCRGPVRQEAIEIFDDVGLMEYGMLLSEKDSVVYPKTLAPELRRFRFPENVHRVPDYMGAGQQEKQARIREIIDIAVTGKYTHIFAGYGFMAEDAEFIAAVEAAGVGFVGPSSAVCRRAGAKDEAKKIARGLRASVTPGVDNVSALALAKRAENRESLEALAAEHGLGLSWAAEQPLSDNAERLLQSGYQRRVELVTIAELQDEAAAQCAKIWKRFAGRRIRFKHIGGGGGKGQRIVQKPEEVADAVMEVLAESKVTEPGSNRNFLIELNIELTRHNEIQLLGNGSWCIALGGRDCSVQMFEQKLLEVSLTREMLEQEIENCRESQPHRARVLETDKKVLQEMESEAERFGEAVHLDSVSTFESIVDGANHYFMEMNTRIQVEHRVTEMVYRLKFTNPSAPSDHFFVESLIEAMLLIAAHGRQLPRPERVLRHPSGAEVRINATNQALQPHAGGMIHRWSPPRPDELRDDQGIGIPNPDTGANMYYNLAGAYDSNIALVVTHGGTRRENFERLAEILRCTELRGQNLETNLPMHYGLLHFILGADAMLKPSTQFMLRYLAAVGSLAQVVRDVDFGLAWREDFARHPDAQARETLKRKQTLILRPIERLFASPHLLAGFLSRENGRLWSDDDGELVFADSPIRFLDRLYRYLHLEPSSERPPSEQIWDHDQAILEQGLEFYDRIGEGTGTEHDWPRMNSLFAADANADVARNRATLWESCRAAHRGFQIGMELLLMIPRAGRLAGFFDIAIDDELRPLFPEEFRDPVTRGPLIGELAPPPPASADEIVTPMGGHFFPREAPHLGPMVAEGDHFEAGQPLFIIEVMKMFNKVRAPFSGTVVKSLLPDADGKIVTKGQAIFKVKPDVAVRVETAAQIGARRRAATLRLMGIDELELDKGEQRPPRPEIRKVLGV